MPDPYNVNQPDILSQYYTSNNYQLWLKQNLQKLILAILHDLILDHQPCRKREIDTPFFCRETLDTALFLSQNDKLRHFLSQNFFALLVVGRKILKNMNIFILHLCA